MLDSPGQRGDLTSYLQIAAQLGYTSNPALNEDKLMDLINTRNIIGTALLKKETIKNKEVILGNHQIEFMELHDNWEEDSLLQNFNFSNTSLATLSYSENLALDILVARSGISYWRKKNKPADLFPYR